MFLDTLKMERVMQITQGDMDDMERFGCVDTNFTNKV